MQNSNEIKRKKRKMIYKIDENTEKKSCKIEKCMIL